MSVLQNYFKTLLPAMTIGPVIGAPGFVSDPVSLGQLGDSASVYSFQAAFLYGAGGTTCKAWVQTSLDGATWFDIISFANATAAATRVVAVNVFTPPAGQPLTGATLTDGALADNTLVNGVIGDRLRVKIVTTGVYTGATSLAISYVPR